jgi:hypothetical protein
VRTSKIFSDSISISRRLRRIRVQRGVFGERSLRQQQVPVQLQRVRNWQLNGFVPILWKVLRGVSVLQGAKMRPVSSVHRVQLVSKGRQLHPVLHVPV